MNKKNILILVIVFIVLSSFVSSEITSNTHVVINYSSNLQEYCTSEINSIVTNETTGDIPSRFWLSCENVVYEVNSSFNQISSFDKSSIRTEMTGLMINASETGVENFWEYHSNIATIFMFNSTPTQLWNQSLGVPVMERHCSGGMVTNTTNDNITNFFCVTNAAPMGDRFYQFNFSGNVTTNISIDGNCTTPKTIWTNASNVGVRDFWFGCLDSSKIAHYTFNETDLTFSNYINLTNFTGRHDVNELTSFTSNVRNSEPDDFWVVYKSPAEVYHIIQWGIDNCTKYPTTSFQVSFIDFETGNSTNVSYKYGIEYSFNNTNKNYSNSGTGSEISLCIAPSINLTSDIFIEYINGSDLYTYYVDDIVLSDTIQTLTLRIAAATADITATVYDQNNELLEGAYIRYLKWDVDTNNYELMGIGKTNFEGDAILPLVQNTELYKFVVYYPYDTLRQTTVPTYITGTTILFQINIIDPVAADFHRTMDIDTNLVFSNITNRFTWTYTDLNSLITQACLDVLKPTARGFNQTISHECLSTVSGVITSDVTKENGTTYCANAEVTLNDEDWFVDSLCYTYPSQDSNPARFMGLLIAFIMTIAFAFAFKYSIELGIVAIPLPLLFCCIMGIVEIATPVAIGIEIAAIVLAIILNRVME